MRSLSRSDAQSTWLICRRTLQAASLLLLAAGCNSGAATPRPLQQHKVIDGDSTGNGSWTVKRAQGTVADSGAPVAPFQDAGTAHVDPKPADPKPAADSGTPQPAQDAAVEAVPAASIMLSAVPLADGAPAPTATSFSIQGPELHVYSAWTNLCGEHTELRKYYEPSGALFYQKLTAFSTDISEPVAFTRKVPLPHNVNVLPAVPNAQGALVVEDNLGLAGTWIGDHSITGTWKLELYLDNEDTPTATRTFELTP